MSPVFDAARRLSVLDVEDGKVRSRHEEMLTSDDPFQKAKGLSELGVATLICGAVSRPLAELLSARGISLVPFVCGPVEEILCAYLEGSLSETAFAMPGCCGRRRLRFGAAGRCGMGRGRRTPQGAG